MHSKILKYFLIKVANEFFIACLLSLLFKNIELSFSLDHQSIAYREDVAAERSESSSIACILCSCHSPLGKV